MIIEIENTFPLLVLIVFFSLEHELALCEFWAGKILEFTSVLVLPLFIFYLLIEVLEELPRIKVLLQLVVIVFFLPPFSYYLGGASDTNIDRGSGIGFCYYYIHGEIVYDIICIQPIPVFTCAFLRFFEYDVAAYLLFRLASSLIF